MLKYQGTGSSRRISNTQKMLTAGELATSLSIGQMFAAASLRGAAHSHLRDIFPREQIFSSIATALSKCQPNRGDYVLILSRVEADGTPENWSLTSEADVDVSGTHILGINNPVIEFPAAAFLDITPTAPDTEIGGLVLLGSGAANIRALLVRGKRASIHDCHIEGSTGAAGTSDISLGGGTGGHLIRNCTIGTDAGRTNTAFDSVDFDSGFDDPTSRRGTRFENCIFYHTPSANNSDNSFLYGNGVTRIVLRNCSFVNSDLTKRLNQVAKFAGTNNLFVFQDCNIIGGVKNLGNPAYAWVLTERVGTRVACKMGALVNAATVNLFSVSGPVRVIRIVGIVTTDIGAFAGLMKLTGPTAEDLCAVSTSISGHVAGTVYHCTMEATDALQILLAGTTKEALPAAGNSAGVIMNTLTNGIKAAVTVAQGAGAIDWYLEYMPLAAGAYVAPV